MTIKALRFKLEGRKVEPVREQLAFESADDILKLKKKIPEPPLL